MAEHQDSVHDPEHESEAASPPRRWQRNLIAVLAALALAHTLVIGIWMAPDSIARQNLGGSSFATYVNPYFSQSWGTLAPNSESADEALQVRARFNDDDDDDVTDWVDITEGDLSASHHRSTQPRARMAARQLATNMNAALIELPGKGHDVVADGIEDDSLDPLRADLRKAEVPGGTIDYYVRNEQMTDRFASLYAHARWGSRVEDIQVRVGIREVPDRASGMGAAESEFEWTKLGWRPEFDANAPVRRAFKEFVQQ